MTSPAVHIRGVNRKASRRNRRGQAVLEFAVALPFLTLIVVGTFATGLLLDRHLTLGQLVRNAGNMYARGIVFDNASTQNKQFLVDAATGMGMTVGGGNAVVYMSLLMRVPADAVCGANPCANAGNIVIMQRFTVGNTSLAPSKLGTPTNLSAQGNHNDFFNDTDAAATSPPPELADTTTGVQPNEIVYLVEVFHNPQGINFQGIFAPGLMYSRAVF